jgi:hypothetical protein
MAPNVGRRDSCSACSNRVRVCRRIVLDAPDAIGAIVHSPGRKRIARLAFASIAAGVTLVLSIAVAPATADDPPFVAASVPTIRLQDTVPLVNEYVFVDNIGWSPSPAAVGFQWLRDGVPIAGETDRGFWLTQDDFGHRISVSMIASGPGNSTTTVTSNPTVPVTEPVQLTGSKFDFPLRAEHTSTYSPGTVFPTDATLTYQWIRGGVAIPGATTPSITPLDSDVGNALTLRVTVSAPGYIGETIDANSQTLTLPAEMEPGPVGIIGTPAVGAAVSADYYDWTPRPTSVTYQWRVNGQDVAGATGVQYVPTPGDLGKTLSVTVTGSYPNYDSASHTSAESPKVNPRFTVAPVPTISGTPTIGGTLTAHTSAWTPKATSYTYSWLVDGVVVSSGPTFSPDSVDYIGKTVTVIDTAQASAAGPEASPASLPTAPVTAGTLKAGTAKFQYVPAANGIECVLTTGWSGGDFSYQWSVDGAVVQTSTDNCYSDPYGDVGKSMSVVVTESGAGLPSVSVTIPPTVIVKGSFIVDFTLLDHPLVVGQTSNLNFGEWTPEPSAFAVKWYEAKSWENPGRVIATGSTFTPSASLSGKYVIAKVTGTGILNPTTTWSDPFKVAPGVLSGFTVATISGTPRVGTTLTAHHAIPIPSSDLSYSYQWFAQKSAGAVANAISKATKNTYKLVSARKGEIISVRVTVKRTGYTSTSITSASTSAVIS